MNMSTAYILLLFLCISLHACNARIGPLDKKMEIKKHHFSTKSDEKSGFDSSPKQLNEGSGKVKDRLVDDNSKKPKSRSRVLNGKASGSLRTESLASVSWRVPHHKKRSQNKHEFDVDYAPPKTHPPSHN